MNVIHWFLKVYAIYWIQERKPANTKSDILHPTQKSREVYHTVLGSGPYEN